MYIKKVQRKSNIEYKNEYYNKIPVIKNFETLTFNKNITFFVGENGSGKSTLLEAIAVAYGFNPEGGSKNFSFSTKNTHSKLSEEIILSRNVYPKDGFFLRAESFYNVATEIDNLCDYPSDKLLNSYGGSSLHLQSHGESFFSLMNNRFRGNGLYILDEPEAALSPQKMLSVLILIDKLSKQNSQFIIATHSPILLGIRDSEIYSFDNNEIVPIEYEETECYLITKMFLENKERMLDNLLQ